MKLFKRRPKSENSERAVSAESEAAPDIDEVASEEGSIGESSTGAEAAVFPASGLTAESQAVEPSSRVFGRLRKGLSRSRDQFTEGLASLVLEVVWK